MGKAQSKRSIDITTVPSVQEIRDKVTKINDADEEDNLALPESSYQKETLENADANEVLAAGGIGLDSTGTANNPIIEQSSGEVLEEDISEDIIKKGKKDKVKKKWSFRSISFSKKDKQKPVKTVDSTESDVNFSNDKQLIKNANDIKEMKDDGDVNGHHVETDTKETGEFITDDKANTMGDNLVSTTEVIETPLVEDSENSQHLKGVDIADIAGKGNSLEGCEKEDTTKIINTVSFTESSKGDLDCPAKVHDVLTENQQNVPCDANVNGEIKQNDSCVTSILQEITENKLKNDVGTDGTPNVNNIIDSNSKPEVENIHDVDADTIETVSEDGDKHINLEDVSCPPALPVVSPSVVSAFVLNNTENQMEDENNTFLNYPTKSCGQPSVENESTIDNNEHKKINYPNRIDLNCLEKCESLPIPQLLNQFEQDLNIVNDTFNKEGSQRDKSFKANDLTTIENHILNEMKTEHPITDTGNMKLAEVKKNDTNIFRSETNFDADDLLCTTGTLLDKNVIQVDESAPIKKASDKFMD